MRGYGRKFNEIQHSTTTLEEHGFSLLGIREWRKQRSDAGLASSLGDFYRLHGIRAVCRGYGLQMTGWDEESQVPLWTICSNCGGTGRVPAEPT